jgi:putative FmdB family regulatory protein
VPLYEYKCRKCGHVFEKIQKFSDKPEASCPECDSDAERQLSAPAVHFKGSGWYITDYARKGKGGDTKEAKGTSTSSPDKSKKSKESSSEKKSKKKD